MTSLSGTFGDNTIIAPVYAGGVPLDVLAALNIAEKGQFRQSIQKFWSTPTRPYNSPVIETIEISIATPKRINEITFQLARFPQTCWIEYLYGSTWYKLADLGKHPISITNTESIPYLISAEIPLSSNMHPQHYGDNHWVTHKIHCYPIVTSRFRLRMIRQAKNALPPVDKRNRPIPYSLGLMNLTVGFVITDLRDLPWSPPKPQSLTVSADFATGNDILGSPVNFAIHQNKAQGLMYGEIWKSEPQPVSNAVVNLYVDARDHSGQAQVIDRFYIDPIYSGANVNLYHSNDLPSITFPADDDPLLFPIIQKQGSIRTSAQGLWIPDNIHQSPPTPLPMPLPHPPPPAPVVLGPKWPGRNLLLKSPLMTGADIDTWQTQMQCRGWDLDADGIFGPQTDSVCRKFQKQIHIVLDGIVGPITWSAAWDFRPGPAWGSSRPPARLFQLTTPYMSGFDIKTWQTQMQAQGYSLAADGIYGPTSKSVCEAFEARSGLDVDGIVGAVVWNASWSERIPGRIPIPVYAQMDQPDASTTTALLIDPNDSENVGIADVEDIPLISVPPAITDVVLHTTEYDPDHPMSSGNLPDEGVSVQVTQPVENIGYLDVLNQGFQLETSQAWWMGLIVKPQFNSDDPYNHTIIATETWTLAVHQGQFTFSMNHLDSTPGVPIPLFGEPGGVVSLDGLTEPGGVVEGDGVHTKHIVTSVDFVVNDALQITLAYGDGTMVLKINDAQNINNWPDPLPIFRRLRFGFEVGSNPDDTPIDPQDPGFGNYILVAFVLKQELLPDNSYFFAHPDIYLWKTDPYDATGIDFTENSLLRMHSSFCTSGDTSVNPFGFIGGPGDKMAEMRWTPIPRDFKVRKGYLEFDPIKAKHFKFEFSNLTAQSYETYLPITRTVKTFPDTITQLFQNINSGALFTADKQTPGMITNQAIAGSQVWNGEPYIYWPTNDNPKGYTPTETLVTTNPNIAKTLRDRTYLYGFQLWHQGFSIPRFNLTQKHVYSETTVEHRNRVAYMTGLQGLSMYRVDYVVDDDTRQYLDLLHDVKNWSGSTPFTWALSDSGLRDTSGLSIKSGLVSLAPKSTGTSLVFSSRRRVRGIQFATQQTPAYQLLNDPDFDDDTLTFWDSYGDASITPADDYNTDIGTTIAVTRGAGGHYWRDLEFDNADWNAIERHLTWQNIEGPAVGTTSMGGLTSTELFFPQEAGRLYVAGRIYCPVAPAEPIYIQLVAEDGHVLVEEGVTGHTGQVSEWFVGYTIGEGGSRDKIDYVYRPGPTTTYVVVEEDTMDSIAVFLGVAYDTLLEVNPGIDPDAPEVGSTINVPGDEELVPIVVENHKTWDAVENSDEHWDDLENETTWDIIDTIPRKMEEQVYVRMIQKNPTRDTWYVDTLSLYEDATVWEFSNNGGVTWYPVYDIRNNPFGVFIFPDADTSGGTKLCWRVTAYRPNVHIASLDVRPWYGDLLHGQGVREGIQAGGPNLSPYDHFPPVTEDPRFKLWHYPIPEDWWFSFRKAIKKKGISGPTAEYMVSPETISLGVLQPNTAIPVPVAAPALVDTIILEGAPPSDSETGTVILEGETYDLYPG